MGLPIVFYNFLNKKHILPNRNLIKNIGIGKNSSNTLRLPYKYFLKNKKYQLNFDYSSTDQIIMIYWLRILF